MFTILYIFYYSILFNLRYEGDEGVLAIGREENIDSEEDLGMQVSLEGYLFIA